MQILVLNPTIGKLCTTIMALSKEIVAYTQPTYI